MTTNFLTFTLLQAPKPVHSSYNVSQLARYHQILWVNHSKSPDLEVELGVNPTRICPGIRAAHIARRKTLQLAMTCGFMQIPPTQWGDLQPDVSQLRNEVSSDLQALQQSLVKEIQQLRISRELESLQKQVRDLSSLVSQPSPIIKHTKPSFGASRKVKNHEQTPDA